MNITNLSPQQLRKAADIQERIQSLQKELGQILGADETTVQSQAPKNGRRRMSAAGRAAISAAAKARWAKIKGSKAPTKPVQKRKRKLSAAGRAALVAAAKARWAKAEKAGKNRL